MKKYINNNKTESIEKSLDAMLEQIDIILLDSNKKKELLVEWKLYREQTGDTISFKEFMLKFCSTTTSGINFEYML